ncbi:MAG: MFS transporter [Actinomycetota bacterium]|nr:MFS transporter [Actinomycetota bacterium]
MSVQAAHRGAPSATLRTNRAATTAVFALNGLVFGAWAGRIPDVKARLGLTESLLGVLLLVAALGALAGMQVVARAVARWGTPRVTTTGVVAVSVLLLPIAFAPSPAVLAAALVVFGMAMGFLDVAMNSHGVWVEERYGRPIMSSLHAFFSLGLLAGAGISGLAARAEVSATASIAANGVVLAAAAAWACSRLSGGPEPAGDDATSAADSATPWPRAKVLLLGVMAFITLMAEGAANDWSAVLLHEERGVSTALAVSGLVAFNATMTVGRLLGDRVTLAWGPGPTLRRSSAVACVGMLAGLVVPGAVAAVVGFALMGIGLSVAVPILFSAAGALPGGTPGQSIARVSTLGYLGFLVGPTAIGFLADATSLTLAFGAAVALLAFVVLGAPATAGRRQAQPAPADAVAA